MVRSNLAILLAAGLLAGCVYEKNEAFAPPPPRDMERETAPPTQAAASQPNRIHAEASSAVTPAAGTSNQPPVDTRSHRMFVQIPSFAKRDQAERARRSLAGLGPTNIRTVYLGKQARYRVRIGPFASAEQGEEIRAALMRRGYNDAVVVRD